MPAQTFDARRLVGVHAERVTDVSSRDFPGHHTGEDHSWNLAKFKKVRVATVSWTAPNVINATFSLQVQNLTVKVQRLSRTSIDFDIVGVDASIANAFRRIMIAEVCSAILRKSVPFFGSD